MHARTHVRASTHTQTHTQTDTDTDTDTHTHTDTQVTFQHTNMCLLALILQHSCLLGLHHHHPNPLPPCTIALPHPRLHLPAPFQPQHCPHTTPSPPHDIATTPSPSCTIVAHNASHPITSNVRPLPTLLPPITLALYMLSAIIILHYRSHCYHPPPSLHCHGTTAALHSHLQPPAQPCGSSTPLSPTLHHPEPPVPHGVVAQHPHCPLAVVTLHPHSPIQ